MENQLVRRAQAADAAAIGAVHYRAWMETYTGLLSPAYLARMSAERSTEIFRREGCRQMFVAVVGDEIVGFCGYGAGRGSGIPETCGEIYGIYVLRAYQNRHLGKQLLERAKAALREMGFSEACLWVLAENERAIRFYEKNGFVLDGEKTENLGTPITEKRGRCRL